MLAVSALSARIPAALRHLSRYALVSAVSTFSLLAPASPALSAETNIPEFGWDWEPGLTYFLEVSLAGAPLWLWADRNQDAVVQMYSAQLLIDCGQPVRENKRHYEVRCDVREFAIQGKPRPSDAGRAQEILEEMDDKVTGAWLQMRFHDNGSLVNFQLEGIETRERKERQMAENIRLILHRAVAGLDLRLPTRSIDREFGVWGQYESVITMFPTAVGTAGSAEIVHLAKQRVDDVLVIETAGRAAISPQSTGDTFDTRIEARTVFNMGDGYMVERIWVAEGWATAGSASSEAGERPYAQAGRLFVVGPNEEAPTLMNTEERGPAPTTLSDQGAMGGVQPDKP